MRLLVGLLAAAALTACSVATDTISPAPAAPTAAHRGGVLKVGITAPGGIDPLNAYEPAGQLVSTAMCDTLVAIDPVTGQLREAIAKGWVLTNDGGITVKTRHDVTFSDGRPLQSTDVNHSLQQLASPANGSHLRDLASPFTDRTSVEDADVLVDPTSRAADVAVSLNRHDFQLAQARPNGGALRSFAEPGLAPFSAAAYDADPVAFAAKPVCVGPYVLAKPFHPGARTITLVRSSKYYGHNVGYTDGGVGYADRIEFTIYPSAAAAFAAYERGDVDVVRLPPRGHVTDQGSLVLGPATAVEYVGLPSGSDSPLGNPGVRLALSLAVDRSALVERVFGVASQPASGFEPPALAITAGTAVGNRDVKGAPLTSCGPVTPAKPDLPAAKLRLLSAARDGDASGFKGFTLEVNNDAPYPALADELARQWKALGLDVKVVTTPWSDYLAKASQGSGMTTAFRLRWASSAPAPSTTYNDQASFLAPLLSGQATDTANWAHWNDRSFDFGITSDATPITDVQQRGIAFGHLTAIACRQMPLIPLVFDRPAYLVRSSVVGSARPVPVGRDGLLLLRELYLK